MISKTRKIKRPSLPSLITKADTITSQYIRRKFADHAGNVTCVTCAKVLPWKDAHCAHFMERKLKPTRWMEENLRPACCHCNTFNKQYHDREYTLYMIDCYGREGVEELKQKAYAPVSPSQVRQLAEEAISHFGQRLKDLA